VARALVLTGDLLFGSNVQGMLAAAGHEVELVAGEDALRAALLREPAQIVIADLTDAERELESVQSVRELREEGFLDGVPLLAFYSHVEPGVREMAEAEGFDQVVPRSRMAREAAALVGGLIGAG
jgi:nucleoside-diphosphate-sugar epimerase